jgi:Homeodomain-like domain-containing protein
MKVYLDVAVEKAMKIQEVILRAIDKKITWLQAAEIIRVSPRQLRRWRIGWEKMGYDGLFDRRLGKPSPKRVPLETVAEVLRLYQEKYAGFSVQHFHEKLVEEHKIGLSYTWVKKALQGAGLIEKEAKRGVHRKKRERRPIPGLLLHIDASKHQWFQDARWHDLIVILDDATSEVYYAQFVDEESTRTVMAALREVIEQKGMFCALYSDRASHFFITPKAGEVVDRQRLTQVGRALAELKIEMIPAYSPQARGRSERNFGTWQGRLPQELKLKGITTVEGANQFLRSSYIEEFNRRFSVPAAQTGNAFLPVHGHDLELVFSLQHERVAGKDNTVKVANLCLQIERTNWRSSLAGCRVKVHQLFDDTFKILYAGRVVGRYSNEGEPLDDATSTKKAMEKWKSQKSRDSHFPTATATTRKPNRTDRVLEKRSF